MVEGHVCDGPVRVIIHDVDGTKDVAIPVAGNGLTLHERKDGPLAVSRRAEVNFPLEAFGTSWHEYINSISNGWGMQKATVQMKPHKVYDNDTVEAGDYQTVLVGYIGAVGSSGTNMGQLTIFGPYNLLTSIPVSLTLQPTLSEPYSTIQPLLDIIQEEQYIFEHIGISILGADTRPDDDSSIDIPFTSKKKQFAAGRDTMADALKWLEEQYNLRIWFEPLGLGAVQLTVDLQPEPLDIFMLTDYMDDDISPRPVTFDARKEGDIDIIENDALYEMKPFNTLKLKGEEVGRGFDSVEDIARLPTGNFPQATAKYEPLVDAAGGEMVIEETSDQDKQNVLEKNARKRLKERLDNVSGGTMTLPLSPFMSPYDRVLAHPACAARYPDSDFPEVRYEIQRTAHKVEPNSGDQGNPINRTEIAVSMSVDPTLIETESSLQTVATSKDSENEPQTIGDWLDSINLGI